MEMLMKVNREVDKYIGMFLNFILVGTVIVSWRYYQSRDIYLKQNDINREEC